MLPAGQVDGRIRVDGREAIVMGGDFTVRGGSAGGAHGGLGTELSASERALEWRIPYIRLLDSAGGSVRSFEALGRTYLPDGNSWTHVDVKLLDTVPVVSAVLGSVAGLPALHAVLAHFNVMTKENAQVFPGGPPVVRAATGTEITKEELGGPTSTCARAASSTTSPRTRTTRSPRSAGSCRTSRRRVDELAPRGPTTRSRRPP